MMFYKLFVPILILCPMFAFADNWVQQPISYLDEKAIYIDTDSIQKSKFGQVTYDLKRVYHDPQDFDNKRKYYAQMVTIKTNCKDRKIAPLKTVFYDKDDVIILTHEVKKVIWQDIGKEPATNERFKFVCNYMSHS